MLLINNLTRFIYLCKSYEFDSVIVSPATRGSDEEVEVEVEIIFHGGFLITFASMANL